MLSTRADNIGKIPLSWYFILALIFTIFMINRAIRTLPFPPVSNYTPEVIAHIKAIPDENIEYTESEIAWMHRALDNLDYMLADARRCNLFESIERLIFRKAQIKSVLVGCDKQQKHKTNDKFAD